MKKLWFRRKMYGWGWYPATWEGWLVVLVYVIAILGFTVAIDETSPPCELVFTFFLPITLLTITLLHICYATGEKPRWQWGNRDKK